MKKKICHFWPTHVTGQLLYTDGHWL